MEFLTPKKKNHIQLITNSSIIFFLALIWVSNMQTKCGLHTATRALLCIWVNCFFEII
uniref:Uncharacterized protein n=1 Tax=Manihot esculenta TaxID=3983 RepID=A0A2C9WB25_MANES